MELNIPFSRPMRLASIRGEKVATSRSKKYGNPGDWFKLPDYVGYPVYYRLIDVQTMPLQEIKTKYYRIEGFASPEAFEEFWRNLHRGQFLFSKDYYVHFYGRINDYDIILGLLEEKKRKRVVGEGNEKSG
jgi:hypothetical protein